MLVLNGLWQFNLTSREFKFILLLMLKKLFTILILGIMVVSVVPTDAFCADEQNSPEHHHGIVLCHSCCSATVVNQSFIAKFTPDQSSQYLSTFSFLYEDPSLDLSNPPPNYSA